MGFYLEEKKYSIDSPYNNFHYYDLRKSVFFLKLPTQLFFCLKDSFLLHLSTCISRKMRSTNYASFCKPTFLLFNLVKNLYQRAI